MYVYTHYTYTYTHLHLHTPLQDPCKGNIHATCNMHIHVHAYVRTQTYIYLLQGPCKGNIHAVLKTQLCDAINRIVLQSHAKLEGVHYTGEYYEQVRALKSEVAMCVLAMLEAASFGDPRVPKTLIRALDMHTMVDYAISMYNVWKGDAIVCMYVCMYVCMCELCSRQRPRV